MPRYGPTRSRWPAPSSSHELMPRINHNYYQQGSWYDLAWNTELTNFGYNNDQAIEQNKGEAHRHPSLHGPHP